MSAELSALQAAQALIDAVETDRARSGGLLEKLTLRHASVAPHCCLAGQPRQRLITSFWLG